MVTENTGRVVEKANKHIAVTRSTQARFLSISRANRERDNEQMVKLLNRWFETGGYDYQPDRRRTRRADTQAVNLDVPEG